MTDDHAGLPRDSGADTAVERWIRAHYDDAVRLGFPIDGYLAERDTTRRLQRRLGEASRIDGHRVARIAQLEEDLATAVAVADALTAPTEYGRVGFQWAAYHDGLEEDELTPVSEAAARHRVAGLRHYGVVSNPLLLRRPHGAWERWPLTPEEADEMEPAEPAE